MIMNKLPKGIRIGYEGEQGARPVALDVSEGLLKWPDSIPTLLYVRPGEREAVPAPASLSGGVLTWVPDAYATQKTGSTGAAQVVFTVSGEETVIGKSQVIPLFVNSSLEPSEDPPEPYESWIASILDAAAIAEGFAADAEESAERAEQAAANSGFMDVEINAAGHLIYTRSDSMTGIDLDIIEGRLIAQWL